MQVQASSTLTNHFSRDPSKHLPVYSAILVTKTHVSDLTSSTVTKVRENQPYSDGFVREIQRKNMCEAGPLTEGTATINNCWTSTGWTIFNNKGKEVQKFEPFFDDTHEVKFDNELKSLLSFCMMLLVVPLLQFGQITHGRTQFPELGSSLFMTLVIQSLFLTGGKTSISVQRSSYWTPTTTCPHGMTRGKAVEWEH